MDAVATAHSSVVRFLTGMRVLSRRVITGSGSPSRARIFLNTVPWPTAYIGFPGRPRYRTAVAVSFPLAERRDFLAFAANATVTAGRAGQLFAPGVISR